MTEHEDINRNAEMLGVEMEHLIHFISGGIAVYKISDGPELISCTEGVAALSGRTLEEHERWFTKHRGDVICQTDRDRVRAAATEALKNHDVLDISFRVFHRDGKHLIWLHLNGRQVGTIDGCPRLYSIITGESEETKLFQSIANEAADGIYVISRDTYDLLYVNESVRMFLKDDGLPDGKKCYEALHGLDRPCDFCTIKIHGGDGIPHPMNIPGNDAVYSTKIKDISWNGIPAYVKYVTDVTRESKTRKEKERLEQYYQTLIQYVPGGFAAIRCEQGRLVPEFFSDRFMALVGMTPEEADARYRQDMTFGIHPEDAGRVVGMMHGQLAGDKSFHEIVFRLNKGDGSVIWVKNNVSPVVEAVGIKRIYSMMTDITKDVLSKLELQQKYDAMLRRNQAVSPNEIIVGHCNITQRKLVEMEDRTGGIFGDMTGTCDNLADGLGQMMLDERERRDFAERFTPEKLETAYENGEMRHVFECFLKFPHEDSGRYVKMNINLVQSPESGDLMGVLSVLDMTEEKVIEKILLQLANVSYDFIADIDLERDYYRMVSVDGSSTAIPDYEGSYSSQVVRFLEGVVLPKDKKICGQMLETAGMLERLDKEGHYSFHYSLMDGNGDIYSKNMLAFYIDRRLRRVCLARTDVTESVRDQQRLLNILAYTFELIGIVDLENESLLMHTKEGILNNLTPYAIENFPEAMKKTIERCILPEDRAEMQTQFLLKTMEQRLLEKPGGYEFVSRYQYNGEVRYKQFNVLWGDESHQTICLVRADVTDMLIEEQRAKENLKDALAIAQEASQAKTDFLSAMSHDIRTPMNAIMGMTDLALADRENDAQVDESLSVIKSSSEHLLSLINDILDMSRIESGRMVLLKERFSFSGEMEKAIVRFNVLAEKRNIRFCHSVNLEHNDCIGDTLRIHQILDNLVGNAMKFTPEGGTVTMTLAEREPKNENIGWYRFVIEDTGVGISRENQPHLFEPFYRTESSMTSRTEGSGLGLSIVKNIVDYKGGMISVESEPGRGSRFIVDLPLHFAERSDVEAPKKAAKLLLANLTGYRLLLVEDNPINKLIALRVLEKAGAKVETAGDGKEACERFLESTAGYYDLILMDIQMPVMNGYEATEAIRGSDHPQASSIPIVAMTANVFAADIRKCMDAGMNAHVGKPIELAKLYDVLGEILGIEEGNTKE